MGAAVLVRRISVSHSFCARIIQVVRVSASDDHRSINEPCVYVMQSGRVTGRAYVGFSVDPAERVRRHNGEIVGGAAATRSGRPWTILLVISGFPSQVSALQFEHALQHPSSAARLPGPRVAAAFATAATTPARTSEPRRTMTAEAALQRDGQTREYAAKKTRRGEAERENKTRSRPDLSQQHQQTKRRPALPTPSSSLEHAGTQGQARPRERGSVG